MQRRWNADWQASLVHSQRVVMPCGCGVKAGTVCVWVAGKTVWSLVTHGPYLSTLVIKSLYIKHYINSSVYLYFTSGRQCCTLWWILCIMVGMCKPYGARERKRLHNGRCCWLWWPYYKRSAVIQQLSVGAKQLHQTNHEVCEVRAQATARRFTQPSLHVGRQP